MQLHYSTRQRCTRTGLYHLNSEGDIPVLGIPQVYPNNPKPFIFRLFDYKDKQSYINLHFLGNIIFLDKNTLHDFLLIPMLHQVFF